MEPILQITLNFLELDNAIKSVKNTTDSAKWIGIGNSLIKNKGMSIIGRVKEEFLNKKILADMMVTDSPVEVEMASRAGADIITVSGRSDDNIILECVNAGKINGTEIIADLRDLSFTKEKIKILEKIGVSYVLLNCENLGDMDKIYNYVKTQPNQSKHVPGSEGFSRISIIAECPIDSETIAYAIESGAGVISLKLNGDDDLRKFADIKEIIGNRFFVKDPDKLPVHSFDNSSDSEDSGEIPAEDEFEKITKVLGGIRKALEDLEMQKSIDLDRRKKLDEETKKLEDEKRKISAEWKKLKDMEIRIEEKKKQDEEERKKREEAFIKLEEEQKRKWEAVNQKKEAELNKIEQELGKIKKVGDAIEIQRKKIADEMRKIEREWEGIEKITKEIGKKEKPNKANKPDKGELKIIGEYNADKDNRVIEPLGDIESTDVEIYPEKNIENDLFKIKEEHKKRKGA